MNEMEYGLILKVDVTLQGRRSSVLCPEFPAYPHCFPVLDDVGIAVQLFNVTNGSK